MSQGHHDKIWIVSLILALGSNAVATTLTLFFDNGTTYVETNKVMTWELSVFGRLTPVVAGLTLAGVYCAIWFFTIRKPADSRTTLFASFVLFFIPAFTLQDALGDASLVFAGIPLLPLEGIQFSAAVYATAFVLIQWRSRRKRTASATT